MDQEMLSKVDPLLAIREYILKLSVLLVITLTCKIEVRDYSQRCFAYLCYFYCIIYAGCSLSLSLSLSLYIYIYIYIYIGNLEDIKHQNFYSKVYFYNKLVI
jgi:hypothetical protein